MSNAVIKELRRLQGLGMILYEHCIRAEHYVARHPEIFCCQTNMTVRQATDLAVESASGCVLKCQ
jgi:hypothetical protein